jgi:hypothetical protein
MVDSPKELYMFRGSQFVIKAMAAMALKGMVPGDGSYVAREVPLGAKERQKLLPAPHTVPIMRWGNDIIPGRYYLQSINHFTIHVQESEIVLRIQLAMYLRMEKLNFADHKFAVTTFVFFWTR